MMHTIHVIKEIPDYLLNSKWVREALARKMSSIFTFRGIITDVKVFINVNKEHHQFICTFTTTRNILNTKQWEEMIDKVSKIALYDVHAAYLNNESIKLQKSINSYIL